LPSRKKNKDRRGNSRIARKKQKGRGGVCPPVQMICRGGLPSRKKNKDRRGDSRITRKKQKSRGGVCPPARKTKVVGAIHESPAKSKKVGEGFALPQEKQRSQVRFTNRPQKAKK